jgi:hypothetical protein
MKKKVLFLGDDAPLTNSWYRAKSLARIGFEVVHFNPRNFTPRLYPIPGLCNRLGNPVLPRLVEHGVMSRIGAGRFDCVWVDNGELVGPGLLRKLARQAGFLVNYNVDDPYGDRDGRMWRVYLEAVPHYDLILVVRQENVAEAEARGAKEVRRVYRFYDPVAYAPRPLTPELAATWASEVLFVGTWMPERGPFMVRLLDLGVPLRICGNDWDLAPERERLKPVWKRRGLMGDDYAYAIQCAKVNLGLCSKGNRDRHTTRSLEIPALGGLLCAVRTDEHLWLYREDAEALFWDGPEECAARCLAALAEPERAAAVARAGADKLAGLGLDSDTVMAAILREHDAL